MCFRPSEAGGIEHRCPECGTNNLPEATMCANCFAPLEPLDIEALMREAAAAANIPPEAVAAAAPLAPGAPKPPAAPKAPAPPKNPVAPTPAPAASGPSVDFGSTEPKADEPGVGEIFSF